MLPSLIFVLSVLMPRLRRVYAEAVRKEKIFLEKKQEAMSYRKSVRARTLLRCVTPILGPFLACRNSLPINVVLDSFRFALTHSSFLRDHHQWRRRHEVARAAGEPFLLLPPAMETHASVAGCRRH
jgi:hypothetical protein